MCSPPAIIEQKDSDGYIYYDVLDSQGRQIAGNGRLAKEMSGDGSDDSGDYDRTINPGGSTFYNKDDAQRALELHNRRIR